MLIVKLSALLRRLLRSQEHFVTLREELDAVDEYLDIERVRFGPSLVVLKEIDEASLDVIVPSMILQPLVENSIKHGLSPKVDGGSIYLRSRIVDGKLVIEVEDDGVGMGSGSSDAGSTGIGLANVQERLHVLYGDTALMEMESKGGTGTTVRLVLPMPQSDDDSMPYEFRSSTSR